jgi:hypothetical protein
LHHFISSRAWDDAPLWRVLEHFHADWKSRSDPKPMKLLAKYELGVSSQAENALIWEPWLSRPPQPGNAPVRGASVPNCQTAVSKVDAV